MPRQTMAEQLQLEQDKCEALREELAAARAARRQAEERLKELERELDQRDRTADHLREELVAYRERLARALGYIDALNEGEERRGPQVVVSDVGPSMSELMMERLSR